MSEEKMDTGLTPMPSESETRPILDGSKPGRTIERAECPHCGRPRTEYDGLGFCLGVLTVADHPPVAWTLVKYVPDGQLQGAVSRADEAIKLLEQALAFIDGPIGSDANNTRNRICGYLLALNPSPSAVSGQEGGEDR